MADIDQRLRELGKHRRTLPASIAVMETHVHAERVNAHLATSRPSIETATAPTDGAHCGCRIEQLTLSPR